MQWRDEGEGEVKDRGREHEEEAEEEGRERRREEENSSCQMAPNKTSASSHKPGLNMKNRFSH